RRLVQETAVVAGLIYLLPLTLSSFFDRYLLPLLPLVLLAAPAPRLGGRLRPHVVAAALLMAGFGVFAVAGTHDYLAWNRARWRALDALLAAGVRPSEIDGGFEFNGRYGYDPAYVRSEERSWYWVQGDQFVVAFGPLPGYETKEAYPYPRWLPGGDGRIL